MKKIVVLFMALILVANQSYAQGEFASTIKNWASYSEFDIKGIDEKNKSAIISKKVEGTNQEILINVYEEFVEFKVLFYSLGDISNLMGNDIGIFIMYLLVKNSEYPFGGWGLSSDADEVEYLGLYYGIPIKALDKQTFSILVNSLAIYAAGIENELNKYKQAKAGYGFADGSQIESLLRDIDNLTKVQRERILKHFKK